MIVQSFNLDVEVGETLNPSQKFFFREGLQSKTAMAPISN